MPPESLLAQWRDMNRRANELERKLFEASLLHTRGDGPRPSPEQWQEAEKTRQEASELFRRAMQAFDDAASAARSGLPSKRQGSGREPSGSSVAH